MKQKENQEGKGLLIRYHSSTHFEMSLLVYVHCQQFKISVLDLLEVLRIGQRNKKRTRERERIWLEGKTVKTKERSGDWGYTHHSISITKIRKGSVDPLRPLCFNQIPGLLSEPEEGGKGVPQKRFLQGFNLLAELLLDTIPLMLNLNN